MVAPSARQQRKHLPVIATALVIAWLCAVYAYSVRGDTAAAGGVVSKKLVTTAFGGRPTDAPLETRSEPVTVDLEQNDDGAEPRKKRERPDRREAGRKKTTKKDRRAEKDIGHSLPVAPRLASLSELKEPHHDYPALDIALPAGTKVRATTAGRVRDTTRWGACGKGVILEDKNDFTYTYCHGTRLQVRRGRYVKDGHTIMRSGNTGDSTGPHLHLQIRRPNGNLVCPQDLLPAWAKGVPKEPAEARKHGCFTGAQHKKNKAKHEGKRR